MRGKRKLWMYVLYVVCNTALMFYGMAKGIDPLSLAAIPASMATGAGVIVWGNVQNARAYHNGQNGKE